MLVTTNSRCAQGRQSRNHHPGHGTTLIGAGQAWLKLAIADMRIEKLKETNLFKIYSKAKYLMSCPPKQQYMALQTNSRQICKHESFIQLSKTSFKMVDRVERNVEAYTLKFNSVQKNVNTNSLIITITNCAQYFCAALLAQKHTNSNYIGIN